MKSTGSKGVKKSTGKKRTREDEGSSKNMWTGFKRRKFDTPQKDQEPKPRLGPPQFKNLDDFFDNEEQIEVDGLKKLSLAPSRSKLSELQKLKKQRAEEQARRERERIRQEEEKARKEREEKREEQRKFREQQRKEQDEQLRQERERQAREEEELRKARAEQEARTPSVETGLRAPKSKVIKALPEQWKGPVDQSVINGKHEGKLVHGAGVDLSARDFGKLVPETAWLNDDCILESLVCLSAAINNMAGVKEKEDVPRCVPISSLYWKAFTADHNKLYPRAFKRSWNMTKENFMQIDTVLIPVNHGAHWTLLVIRPSQRTIAYCDSFGSAGASHVAHAREWLSRFLGGTSAARADEWDVVKYNVPGQTNMYDCGVFVITNAMFVALGLDPAQYEAVDMPLQRRRLAAVLLNGGFHGDFDLSDL
ncbi:hypothetical protein GGR56DRAFT_668584 [Xylariaceae sp. FL0804]|nr:hypothetical protein GGR56DRAFT_668584 [Xylariaceae sp. FL0804]